MTKVFRSAGLLALVAWITVPGVSKADGGSVTITNLPEIDFGGFQVNSLNNAGELTGFFYAAFDHPPHIFTYTNGLLTDLGTLGGDVGQGNMINSSGKIAGESQPAGSFTSHAFLYDGNQLSDLGTLGGSSSRASLINDAGQAAGSALTGGDVATHAFLFDNNTLNDLDTLGGTYSTPFGLNKSGQVVGQSTTFDNQLHAFFYSGGSMHDLGTFGGHYSAAFSINDSGVIVGESTPDDMVIHPFLFANNTMTDLQGLGGSYATTYNVNSANQVLGLSSLEGDMAYHAYVFANGHLTDLGTLGGANSFPYAQNNLGQVVGQADTADSSVAFLWQQGTMIDLNTLLPTNSGWHLDLAVFINDAGRIVGVGEHDGLSEWFIMDLSSGGNNPPVAVAGPDVAVDCQTAVTLDGSHSSDPDGDALSFEWTCAGYVLGTNATLTGTFAVGTNVVTLTVTDPSGASALATVTVTVADTTAPVIAAPSKLSLSADANCQAVLPNLLPQVSVSDNCTPVGSISLHQSPAAGTSLSVGAYSVTITAKDASGNESSATVLVTVADTTAPVIVSGPSLAPVAADVNCLGPTPSVTSQIQATDNCTAASALQITQSPVAGALVGLGAHAILVTVKDAAGNQTQGTLTFSVVDKTAPVITGTASSVTISADANCQAVVPNVLANVSATDNCTPAGQVLLAQSPVAGTPVGKGVYFVTVTATDASGNASSQQLTLNVVDTTAPVITGTPASLTVSVDAQGLAAVPNVLANLSVSDNCSAPNQVALTQSPVAGTLVHQGTYTVTVTATDAAGNSSSIQLTLNAVDTTAPAVTSVPAAATVSVGANCQAVVPDLLGRIVASDNCTPANQLVLTQSPAAGTVLGKGSYPVTITVADAAGNVTTVQTLLTVADTTAPVVSSVSASPSVLSPPNHQMMAVSLSVRATDNCDVPTSKIVSITCNEPVSADEIRITGNLTASLAASRNGGGNGRIYTITIRCSDSSGNSSTATTTVTVPKGK